jgi:histidine decarboxylase
MNRDLKRILPDIISPWEEYCSSAGTSPSSCYIAAPTIGSGVAKLNYTHTGSQLLDKIVAFDRAEASAANLTQTNMITVSSFNGLNGALWGYDICKEPERKHNLVNNEKYSNVFDLEPLLIATHELFGGIHNKHFPIAPGQHLLCAYKCLYENGPTMMYGALAVAIAKDRSRNADLFMEDHGTLFVTHNKQSNLEQQTTVIENLIQAVQNVSDNLGVEYEKIFVALKCKAVNPGEVGCMITAAPYVKLAKKAVPENPMQLAEMSLSDWKAFSKGHYMSFTND